MSVYIQSVLQAFLDHVLSQSRFTNNVPQLTHEDNKPNKFGVFLVGDIDGLVQNCGISSANALEIPQFSTKPLMYSSLDVIMI